MLQGWLTTDWVGAEDFREGQASWRCERRVDEEYRKLSFNLFYLVEGRIGSAPSLPLPLEIQYTVPLDICAIPDTSSIFLPACLWVFPGCLYSPGRWAEPVLRRISTPEQGTLYAETRSCCSFPWVYLPCFMDFTQQSVLYASWSNEVTLDNCNYMQNMHIKDITIMAAQPKIPELCSCSNE